MKYILNKYNHKYGWEIRVIVEYTVLEVSYNYHEDFSIFSAASVQNIFHADKSRSTHRPPCESGPMAQKIFIKLPNIKFHENPFGDTRVPSFEMFIMVCTTQTHSSHNLSMNFVTSFWRSTLFRELLVFRFSEWVYSMTLSCIQNMKCDMQSTCQVLHSTGSSWPTWKRRSEGVTRRTRTTWGQREAWIIWFPTAAYGRHTAQHQTTAGQGVWWSWVSLLACDNMQSARNLMIFWKNLLWPSLSTGQKREAAYSSRTSVNFKTIWHHTTEVLSS